MRDPILVLSTAGADAADAAFLSAVEQLGWAVICNASAGLALRHIVLVRPLGVIVLLDGAISIGLSCDMIVDLRRYKPQLPLVAVAPQHSDAIETRVRAAGATAYLSGTSPDALAQTAGELIANVARAERSPPELVPRLRAGRAAPGAQRRGPPRVRGRPPSQRG
jgi:DNA-binding NarL/FixJ family response regulator